MTANARASMTGALAWATLAVTAAACSLGEGQASISGTLNVPSCWAGHFELKPDFLGAVAYRESLQIRLQSGGDYQTFSDGISILVDDVNAIRPGRGPGLLGQELAVSLPPEVTPPGVPIKPEATPALVHLALYLQRSCRIQNVALYAMSEVSLGEDGTCDTLDDRPLDCAQSAGPANEAGANGDAGPANDSGATPDAEVTADAGSSPTEAPIGRSVITFTHLFNGKPDEPDAKERLTQGSFDVYLGDPREQCPGGLGPPPRCRGHLRGNFSFFFQRGRPAQPFP